MAQQGPQVQQLHQFVEALLLVVPVVDGWQEDIFLAGQGGDQVIGLEDEADVFQSQAGIVDAVADQLAVEPVFTPIIALHQAQDIQHGRLAGAGLSHNGDIAVVGHIQIHIAEHRPQIAFLDVLQLQMQVGHRH